MRSDCIEGEMHQKLFGGRAPLRELKVPPGPRCICGRAGQWGSDGGKDKRGDGRVERGQKEGERGKGMKERREGLCPTRN